MSSSTIALITFIGIFGCARLGLLLGGVLPQHHLTNESKKTVKLAAGLIATMVAIVPGMRVSSAKASFDGMSSAIPQMGAKTIQLDQTLAHYGPETQALRENLRATLAAATTIIREEEVAAHPDLGAIEKSTAAASIPPLRQLDPRNDAQRQIREQAIQIAGESTNLRWMAIEQWHKTLPSAVLLVLAAWLAILFVSFGLFARRNATVISALCLSALSVSGAVFLILELNNPLDGVIKVSAQPLVKALEFVGKNRRRAASGQRESLKSACAWWRRCSSMKLAMKW